MPGTPIPERAKQLLGAGTFERDAALEAWSRFKATGGDIETLPARHHALLPLVARNFARHDIDVPERGRLQGITRRTWYRTRILADSTGKALDVLAANGIAAMPLKGGALLAKYDPDFGAHYMNDIDILVRPRDARRAFEALLAGGWTVSSEHRSDFRGVYRYEHGAALHDAVRSGLDLHWAAYPMERKPRSDNGLWRRAVPATFAGRDVLVPGPEDMFVHVLMNGSRRGGTFRWVGDALTMASAADLDWSRVEAISAARKVRQLLAPALLLLGDEFGAPIPADLAARFAASRDLTLARRLEGRAINARNWRMRHVAALAARYLDASQPWPFWRRVTGVPAFLQFIWKLDSQLGVPREAWRWFAGGRAERADRAQLHGD